jgi:hypothetical protein
MAHAYAFLVSRAMFEWKAGQEAAAAQLMAEANQAAADPASVLLCAVIEAQRYQLGKKLVQTFQRQFDAEIRKRARGAGIGEMSRLLRSYLVAEIDYPLRDKHVEQLTNYIERASRVRLAEADLRETCQFLSASQCDSGLLEEVLQRARRNHPDTPLFWLLTAESEYRQGPFGCDRRFALRSLEKARQLIEAAPDCEDAALLPAIKERETFFRELAESSSGPPDMLPPDMLPPGPVPKDLAGPLLDMIGQMCQEDGVPMEELLDHLADELGFDPFADVGRPRTGKRKKKR